MNDNSFELSLLIELESRVLLILNYVQQSLKLLKTLNFYGY